MLTDSERKQLLSAIRQKANRCTSADGNNIDPKRVSEAIISAIIAGIEEYDLILNQRK